MLADSYELYCLGTIGIFTTDLYHRSRRPAPLIFGRIFIKSKKLMQGCASRATAAADRAAASADSQQISQHAHPHTSSDEDVVDHA